MAVNQNHSKTVLVKVKPYTAKDTAELLVLNLLGKADLKDQCTVNSQHRLYSLQRVQITWPGL